MDLNGKNIVEIFLEAGKQNPDRIAIIHSTNQITYSRLEEKVRKTASYLLRKGIGSGDKVFILLPMNINLYRIIMAVNFIGATAVVLDEWVSLSRMEECCRIVGADALVMDRKLILLRLFSPELRRIKTKLGTRIPKEMPRKEVFPIEESQTALITFTTGSTGTPKAAKRSYGFLKTQLLVLKKEVQPSVDHNDLISLPIMLFMNLSMGVTSIIADFNAKNPGRLKPAKLAAQITLHRVQRITCSPSLILRLGDHIQNKQIKLNGLKQIFTGGAPVFPEDAKLLTTAFPNVRIHILYGSTEAEPISSIPAEILQNTDPMVDGGLLVGKIIPDAEVRIISIREESIALDDSQNLEDLCLEKGMIGEIIVSGKHVLKEYYNEALHSRFKIRDGNRIWHRTGDAGFLDEKNQIYLTGRCNAMISQGGKLISPLLYESFLRLIPGVQNGTMLLVNNKLITLIEAGNRNEHEKIRGKIKKHNLQPDEIRFIGNIPLDPRHYSKIDYERLRSLIKFI